MKNKKIIAVVFIAGLSLLFVHPTGDNKDGMGDAAFAPLEEGQEDIHGVVIDENTHTELSQISFFGHTTVGGIRCEENDSMTKFDLGHIQSLEVLSHAFTSKRFPDKDFVLIRKITLGDSTPRDLLVPRNILLCGTEKATGDQKSWKISQINKLIIHKDRNGANELVGGNALQYPISTDNVKPVPVSASSQAPLHSNLSTHGDEQKPKTIVRDHYKQMEVKVVESKENVKSIPQALREFVYAIVEVVKSFFNAVRGLFMR